MLPPRPPSPPSGPPRGTCFSRLKLTAPSPPLPACTSIRASSMNFIRGGRFAPAMETKKPYRRDRAWVSGTGLGDRYDAHRVALFRALVAETDDALDFRE